jgi:hypothetical protein
MSQNTKRSYSFKEGLAMMAAKEVGIDPYLAADAGEDARSILAALRRAKSAKGAEKSKHIAAAQTELRKLNPKQHGKLINALQAKVLALQGRGRDTAVAHLEPGEMVVPRAVLTPQLAKLIAAEAAKRGIDPKQLIVGSRNASINPATGAEEFSVGFGDWIKEKVGSLFDSDSKLDMTGVGPLKNTQRHEELVPAYVNGALASLKSDPQMPSWMAGLNTSKHDYDADIMHPATSKQFVGTYTPPQRREPQNEQSWADIRKKIQDSSEYMSEILEPFDAVGSTLPMPPQLETAAKLVGAVSTGLDVANRATAGTEEPRPSLEGQGMPAKLFRIADDTDRYASAIGTTAALMSINPAWAPATAPIAGTAGVASGGSKLTKFGLSRYCRGQGLKDDCTR